jgi:hypothetical protein
VIAFCAVILQLNYHLFHAATLELHREVMAVLGIWAMLSTGCQWLLSREWRPKAVRVVWLGIDAGLMTIELWLVEAGYSPLLITYSLLIVASGLWFRANLVWFTTAMATGAYLILIMSGSAAGSVDQSPHYHVIFVVGLLALGFMVTYQVQRVRVLSRYYECRPLP